MLRPPLTRQVLARRPPPPQTRVEARTRRSSLLPPPLLAAARRRPLPPRRAARRPVKARAAPILEPTLETVHRREPSSLNSRFCLAAATRRRLEPHPPVVSPRRSPLTKAISTAHLEQSISRYCNIRVCRRQVAKYACSEGRVDNDNEDDDDEVFNR